MTFLLAIFILLVFFFGAVALMVALFMDKEGKQALLLNAQVEMQIILEDLETITRFSARVRLVRMSLNNGVSLKPVFN